MQVIANIRMIAAISLAIAMLGLAACGMQPVVPVVVPLQSSTTLPPTATTTTLPMPVIPQSTRGAPEQSITEIATTGNGEDSTVYCAARFGAGVGVTCQAGLLANGEPKKFCYYANGYWFDAMTGRMIHSPSGTAPDQRPTLGEVPPYGYASLNGWLAETWLECPQRVAWMKAAAPNAAGACVAMARSEYHDAYNFCR